MARISSRADNHNRGWLCVKGRFGYEFINSPDRLTTPLIRPEKGAELQPATWEEAFSLIVSKFTQIRDEYGGDALAGLAIDSTGRAFAVTHWDNADGTSHLAHPASLRILLSPGHYLASQALRYAVTG